MGQGPDAATDSRRATTSTGKVRRSTRGATTIEAGSCNIESILLEPVKAEILLQLSSGVSGHGELHLRAVVRPRRAMPASWGGGDGEANFCVLESERCPVLQPMPKKATTGDDKRFNRL